MAAHFHLYSRIPFYRLPDVLRDHPRLAGTGRMTLGESFKTTRLKLWDTLGRRLVTFEAARALRRNAAPRSVKP